MHDECEGCEEQGFCYEACPRIEKLIQKETKQISENDRFKGVYEPKGVHSFLDEHERKRKATKGGKK